MSSTGMTRRGYLDKRHCPSGRPKSQCSYSYGMNRSMTQGNLSWVSYSAIEV
ncbi:MULTISPECIES: hypothetical protein [unclassified Wolbachia]|uniref:hypothetical protein n=1 Tax=unclassified Wolbachia TaxID=2640676 RepID=UPI002230727F|nr:hypothetical protein [Wolbachia endosymbiont (group A) of Apoderus coryli]